MSKKYLKDQLEENKEKIEQLFNQQLNITELGRRFNVSQSTMARFLSSHGLNEPKGNNQYTFLYSHLDDFRQDYLKGILTLDELVLKYKAPQTALHSLARKYGWKRATNKEKINREELKKDYLNKKLNLIEICRKYQTTPNTMYEILKEENIELFEDRHRLYSFDLSFLIKLILKKKHIFWGLFLQMGV